MEDLGFFDELLVNGGSIGGSASAKREKEKQRDDINEV